MVHYKEVPSGFDFNTKFDTWILAFCPDTLEWFATNKRFFYYEYPMEFKNEADAVDYFIKNASKFYELEKRWWNICLLLQKINCGYQIYKFQLN